MQEANPNPEGAEVKNEEAKVTTPAQPVENVTEPVAAADSAPAAEPVNQDSTTPAPQEKKVDEKITEGLQNLTKPAPNQPKVSGEEKLWGFISYLPLIGPLLALILKPNSDYIKLHGRQGLLIFIFFFFNIFIYLFPYIGPFLGIVVHFALLILAVYSMYQALIGNWWKIPVFGDISEMIPTDLFVKVTREAAMGPEKIEKNQATVDEVKPVEEVPQAAEDVKTGTEDKKVSDAQTAEGATVGQEPQSPAPDKQ